MNILKDNRKMKECRVRNKDIMYSYSLLYILYVLHAHNIEQCIIRSGYETGKTLCMYRETISLRFSSNSEAHASEFLENHEEMFL